MSSDYLKSAWRKAFPIYAVEGVASSGPAKPSKALVNGLGDTIADRIDELDATTVKLAGAQTIAGVKSFVDGIAGLPNGAAPNSPATKSQLDTVAAMASAAADGYIKFSTKAAMDANLAYNAGAFAIVWDDPVSTNNRKYVKSGSSGSGSWGTYPDQLDNEVARALSAESAMRDILSGFGVVTPSTGTLQFDLYVQIWPFPVNKTGFITKFNAFGKAGADGEAFKVRVFDRADDVLTLSGTAYVGASSVGAFSRNIPIGAIPVREGQYIGVYGPHLAFSTNEGQGHYSMLGDVDTGTINGAYIPNPTYAPQFGVEITSYSTTAQNVQNLMNGGVEVVRLSTVPCIAIGVDSHAAALHNIKNKTFPSRVSQRSDWRILNMGRPGGDILDATKVIRTHNTTLPLGRDLSLYNLQAYIAYDGANDNTSGYMIPTKLLYWQENLERFADTAKALGARAWLITQFATETKHLAVMAEAARARGVGFYDGGKYGRALGFKSTSNTVNFSYSNHFSPRGNWIMAQAALDVVRAEGEPDSFIKIYRKRPTFSVSTPADLLTADVDDRFLKLEEISIGERLMTTTVQSDGLTMEAHHDQINRTDVNWNDYSDKPDEYVQLETGKTVSFTDYLVVRAGVRGTASSYNKVTLRINEVTAGATVWVRDYWDAASGVDGSLNNGYVITADYLAKHNLPVGAWRQITTFAKGTEVDLGALRGIMNGNAFEFLIVKSGAAKASEPILTCYGRGGRNPSAPRKLGERLGATEMLTNYKFGASLAPYVLSSGSPTTFNDPLDPSMYPVDPASAPTRVTYAARITDTNIIGDTFSFTASPMARKLRVRIWARYNPKAFLDLTYAGYAGFNPAYVVNTDPTQPVPKVYPDDSPIRPGTADAAPIFFEWMTGTTLPSNGGIVHRGLATTAFIPIEVDIHLAEGAFDTAIAWKLYTDGTEIDVAMISCREVLD